MADNQPTILVKKSDGTFVRVPLSELKKKGFDPVVSSTASSTVTTSTVSEETPPSAPETKKWIQKTTPSFFPNVSQKINKISDINTTDSVPVKEKPEDFRSLLEEENEIIMSQLAPKTSVSRDSDVDVVVNSISFSVPASFLGRLRTIIQLRLKDVRGANETHDLVLRSIKDGGLGLTESQANELEQKCILQMDKSEKGSARPLKNKKDSIIESPVDLPKRYEEPSVPANITPFNSFIHDDLNKTKIENVIEEFKISSLPKPKPVVKDIDFKPVAMGPIDEIKFFRLVDWRRLANNPTESANRLKQKFINLKDESVLLFFDAVKAWRESPLFLEYIEFLNSSFNKKIKLEVLESEKDKINLEEIKALIKMEKELGI